MKVFFREKFIDTCIWLFRDRLKKEDICTETTFRCVLWENERGLTLFLSWFIAIHVYTTLSSRSAVLVRTQATFRSTSSLKYHAAL